MANRIYLDHHSATRPHPSSIEALLSFLKEHWGSSASPHQMGQELLPFLKTHTEAILEILGAREEDRFHFFSSSAEAIHHLFLTHYFDSIKESGKNHLLTTNIEEAPVLISLKRLEELGCARKTLSVNAQGQLTQEILMQALRPRTSLVSLSWANGLTGVIHPIADLAEACKAKGVLLHVDASYVIGKLFFRFEDLSIDFLTWEGSLLHAPKGAAGMLVKEKIEYPPPLSAMSGVSVGGIAALAQGLKETERHFDHLCLETARLRDRLEQGILAEIPEAIVFFSHVDRLPNCTAIGFPGVMSDALLFLLHRRGVYASVGGGNCQKLSHVLIASGIDEMLAQSALSFTLSFETTEEEIEQAIAIIATSVRQLQKMSKQLL